MDQEAKRIALYVQRYKLLREIGELQIEPTADETAFLNRCCSLLLQDPEYCLIWVGQEEENGQITPVTTAVQEGLPARQCRGLVTRLVTESSTTITAAQALATGAPAICSNLAPAQGPASSPWSLLTAITGSRSCGSWPLVHDQQKYGVLTIHSIREGGFTGIELDFIANVVATVSRSLYLRHTSRHLRLEQDFNCEIVQTVQALLISLSHCGEILSFNPTAQEVTGYLEAEVKGKFWVDVLISPDKRAESQNQLSRVLKGGQSEMNFQAELQTRSGDKRMIEWHGSIRPDIEQGRVGLVLFGIDVTGRMAADRALNHALARWENIFSSVQDPALIVSGQGVILDVNPAGVAAGRRSREENIGRGGWGMGAMPRSACWRCAMRWGRRRWRRPKASPLGTRSCRRRGGRARKSLAGGCAKSSTAAAGPGRSARWKCCSASRKAGFLRPNCAVCAARTSLCKVIFSSYSSISLSSSSPAR